jgi:hypothetical protein
MGRRFPQRATYNERFVQRPTIAVSDQVDRPVCGFPGVSTDPARIS